MHCICDLLYDLIACDKLNILQITVHDSPLQTCLVFTHPLFFCFSHFSYKNMSSAGGRLLGHEVVAIIRRNPLFSGITLVWNSFISFFTSFLPMFF